MEEPLEIPIMNDLTMVLGSISQVTFQFQYLFKLTLTNIHWSYHFDHNKFYQSKDTGVVVDFTKPSAVYDNVKQVRYLNTTLFLYQLILQPQ